MMIVMVNGLNKSSFGGKRMVTCWTCHRGTRNPRVIPDLAIQYSDMPDAEPDEIFAPASGVPSIDQILNKYIQALGGASRVSSVTSLAGKGTYEGYDTEFEKVAYRPFWPKHRISASHHRPHIGDGTDTSTFDGHLGWRAAPETLKPKPIIDLTGGDLDGAKLDAEIAFPARIKQMLTEWRVGVPETIDNKDIQVVQGRLVQGGLPVKLYFDPTSGLLVRMIHYTSSPVGVVPTQVDYTDYRDVIPASGCPFSGP